MSCRALPKVLRMSFTLKQSTLHLLSHPLFLSSVLIVSNATGIYFTADGRLSDGAGHLASVNTKMTAVCHLCCQT